MKFLLLTSYAIAFFQPFLVIHDGVVDESSQLNWTEEIKAETNNFKNFVLNVNKAKVDAEALICESGLLAATSVPSIEEMAQSGSVTGDARGSFTAFGLTPSEMHQVASYVQEFKKSFADGEASARIVLCDSGFSDFLLLSPKYVDVNISKRDDPAQERPNFRTKEQLEAYIKYLKYKIKHSNRARAPK